MIKSFIKFNKRLSRRLETTFPKFFGTPCYTQTLLAKINAAIERDCPKVLLEVGGVDRPLLKKSSRYQYIGVDIDNKPECLSLYDTFLVQSIEDRMPVDADMIFSTTLLEHVPNNRASAHSMFKSLKAGGSTHHYVPSKWHPYAICLRVVGPTLQKSLIRILRPEAVGVTGYPTFFNHCTPSAMARLFREAGFEEIEVIPFYRAIVYFEFFVPLFVMVAAFENLAKMLHWRVFASGFVISAVKPENRR